MLTPAFDGLLVGYIGVSIIMACGYVARRINFFDARIELGLNRIAIFIASPALYFTVLTGTEASLFLSDYTLATVLAMFICIVLTFALLRIIARKKSWAEVGFLSSAIINPNSGNIGIPVSLAVLGTTSFLSPVMLIQSAILSPMLLVILELSNRNRPLHRTLIAAFLNPMVIAAVLGTTLALTSTPVPSALEIPIGMLGDASIPLMLLAFGAALRGTRPFRDLLRQPVLVLMPVIMKSLALPIICLFLAAQFGLNEVELAALIVVAGLPIAQNLYALASNYGVAPDTVRTIVIMSNLVSLPIALVFAAVVMP